ncbi:MAG: porin [Hyphomicrobium sp.]
MTSASKIRIAPAALMAALGVFAGGMTTASAADLGGNCCADLEERIAELEATTARKGNRKVSLEISGQVNEAVMFWDDGEESNAYVVTNDNSRSRFRFKGDAKIVDGWKAGYLLELGARSANSKRSNQDNDQGDGAGLLDLRHSYWFIDSKQMGRISVGLTGGASEGVTEINLSQTKDVAKFSDQEDTGLGLFLRNAGGGLSALSWRRLIRDNGDQPGEGRRSNIVKYDTPSMAGFVATAAWGEDDHWDVGLRYAGEFGGFKLGAGIAYGENRENTALSGQVGFECLAQGAGALASGTSDASCNQIGGSVSVMHVQSGIYVNFGAGQLQDDLIGRTDRFQGTGADDESTFYAVEAGIEQKWNELGKTTIFGQYYQNDGGANARRNLAAGDAANPFAGASRIFETELTSYGGGVVQGIDAAAMSLYVFYRHYEADVTALSGTTGAGARGQASLEDLDVVMGGAIIKF